MSFWLNYLQESPLSFLWDYALPFVVVLSVLVFVHEWGHYIVARMCGVRVETFSIGFGREIFGWTDKNDTRWKISLIPLGGYVKMFGDLDPASAGHSEDVKDKDGTTREMTAEEREVAFFTKSVSKRFAIVFAGPAINFLFAIVILTGLYTYQGQPFVPPVAGGIVEDGRAAAAGILPGDKIIAIDGRVMERFQDIQRVVAVALETPLDLTVERAVEDREEPQILNFTVTPKLDVQTDRFGFIHQRGLIGIVSPQDAFEMQDHGPVSAFIAANVEVYVIVGSTLEAIGQMITGKRSAEELGGIIRIGALAGDFAQAGWVALITFAALLSVNLGLINLFPIPLLDGGHLFFYIIEGVKGSPLPDKVQEYSFRAGLFILVSVMLFATWNDLKQLEVIDFLIKLTS